MDYRPDQGTFRDECHDTALSQGTPWPTLDARRGVGRHRDANPWCVPTIGKLAASEPFEQKLDAHNAPCRFPLGAAVCRLQTRAIRVLATTNRPSPALVQ